MMGKKGAMEGNRKEVAKWEGVTQGKGSAFTGRRRKSQVQEVGKTLERLWKSKKKKGKCGDSLEGRE